MKDSDLRGIILKQLYDNRDRGMSFGFADGDPIPQRIQPTDWIRVCRQLSELNLIDWEQMIDSGPRRAGAGIATINAFGVDIMEGEAQPPVAIHIDQSQIVSVTGSQGVQIAGHQSTLNQTVSDAFEKVIAAVNGSDVSEAEKKRTKGILVALLESKVIAALVGPAAKVLLDKLN